VSTVGVAKRLALFAPLGIVLRLRPLVPQMPPERLAVYTRELEEHASQPGSVLEVGCFRGGTTVYACEHMRRAGTPISDYMVVDTFAGFVADQFDADTGLGTPPQFRVSFGTNSRALVARTMRHYHLREVRVVQGDIVAMPAELLPEAVKVCLMDVDLAVPIEVGLEKIKPRMLPGAVVLVDDCHEGSPFGARVGYERFCRAHGLPEKYEAGLGLIHT
jgi:Methyltransferase domain